MCFSRNWIGYTKTEKVGFELDSLQWNGNINEIIFDQLYNHALFNLEFQVTWLVPISSILLQLMTLIEIQS